jgi:uncharacterized protein with von Willebrand factor type A (vWA) domain
MVRGYRYGAWHDGPDPLAPPYDVRAALDRMGDEVLAGSTPADALRNLMHRGSDAMRGLDEMLRRVRQQRRDLRERGRLDGTLEEVRRLLDTAIGQERSANSTATTGDRPRHGRRTTRSATCCAARFWTASSAG